MDRTRSNLIFLAVGAAVGAAIGYVIASDKKEQWLKEADNLVGKIKRAVAKKSDQIEEIIENAEDE